MTHKLSLMCGCDEADVLFRLKFHKSGLFLKMRMKTSINRLNLNNFRGNSSAFKHSYLFICSLIKSFIYDPNFYTFLLPIFIAKYSTLI